MFARVLGRPVRYHRLPLTVARLTLGSEFADMFRWFNKAGYRADIPGLRARFPELELKTLEEWLRAEGWSDGRSGAVRRDKLGRPLASAR